MAARSNNLASREAESSPLWQSSPSTRPPRPQNLAMENMQNVTAALNALGVKTCLACGKAGAKSLCMGCRSVSFCGKACQKVAWPGHKKECRRVQREKARVLDKAAADFAADEAMAADARRAALLQRTSFLDARRGEHSQVPGRHPRGRGVLHLPEPGRPRAAAGRPRARLLVPWAARGFRAHPVPCEERRGARGVR